MRHYLSEENRKIKGIACIYNYFNPIRMPLAQSDTIEKRRGWDSNTRIVAY